MGEVGQFPSLRMIPSEWAMPFQGREMWCRWFQKVLVSAVLPSGELREGLRHSSYLEPGCRLKKDVRVRLAKGNLGVVPADNVVHE